MEVIAKVMNIGLTVTDENPASSYGIPVVVWRGQVYGDDDLMDEYGHTGRKAKIDLAHIEHRDDPEIYNWICQGTGHAWTARKRLTRESWQADIAKANEETTP